ncbi:hypothetical protein AB6A40_009488 [Gnathostoma spinigerum]|uniref:Uncharacterized protein n=1 Tax=Gnathostoma spinigerum TaxID=75299 RepID=A0ABD6EX96_9BILA
MNKFQGTNEVKEVSRIVNDPLSESILTMWSRPNPEAKSGQIFGGHRNVIPKMTGGRELSEKEQNECRAAIPRFQDPRHTLAAIANGRPGDNIITGLHNNRKTITPVEGLETPDGQHELEPHRYMAWLGGQLTLQSQSRTGGFNKTRDVVSPSYYDHCMNERRHSTKELRKKFERLGKEENPENISNSETDDTDISNTDEILDGDHEETKKNDCNGETHETISDAL